MNSGELDRWFRNPSDLEVWEDIAAWFHKETGHLRPGKAKPAFFHQTPEGEPDCCEEAWREWTEAKRADAMRSLIEERKRIMVGLEWFRDAIVMTDETRRGLAANFLNPKA